MILLGTQLLQNRRIDRRNEGLNKRIGPDSSELVNRNKRGIVKKHHLPVTLLLKQEIVFPSNKLRHR